MKYKASLFSILSFMFAVALILTFSFATHIQASASEINSETHFEECEEYVSFHSSKQHFTNEENIIVDYFINSENQVVNFIYTEVGFEVISASISPVDTNRITFELSCIPDSQEHVISLQILLSSGHTLTSNLYAFQNEYGVFINPFSEDAALHEYFKYALSTNLMTHEEYEVIWAELSQRCVKEDLTIENTSNISGNNNILSSSEDTYIVGNLYWKDDDGLSHPLRDVMVEIYDEEPSGVQVLGTTYTNDYGHFSFPFENADRLIDFENGGYDIFVRIYAGNENAMLNISDSNIAYYYESNEIHQNVSTGSTITYNLTFEPSNDLGKAFQISQAILTARNYAELMLGNIPETVTVGYPYGDTCRYYNNINFIGITGAERFNETFPNSYACWDAIMHEYGHHIQHQLGLTQSPGGTHYSYLNDADILENKEKGVKLAWGEAWPTVFALLAQEYYRDMLSSIDTVADTSYTSYKGVNYDIENNSVKLGEACEQSITAVLWDIFDTECADEDYDILSFGYQAFWRLSTANNSVTFSDFVNCFYDIYPNYTEEIGLLLTYYHMSPAALSLINVNDVSSETPPMFAWAARGGSELYPNNSFRIIIYDALGNEILVSNATTSTNYTLTSAEWNSVLRSYGTTYTVAVAASQTDFLVTGEYISARSIAYEKTIPSNLSKTIHATEYYKYHEDIVFLMPRQYIDYVITSDLGGRKTIQTFGTKDTVISIYDANGNLVATDNDSGYENNAFIYYYFNPNVQYTIRVQFSHEDQCGETKFAFTPANGARNPGSNTLQTYEDIYSVVDHTRAKFTTYSYPGFTKMITFTPPETGTYTFEIESTFDSFIYLIDPRSTSILLNHINYDDDSGDGLNALLTTTLDADIPYLIIYSPYRLNSLTDQTELIIWMTKNDS